MRRGWRKSGQGEKASGRQEERARASAVREVSRHAARQSQESGVRVWRFGGVSRGVWRLLPAVGASAVTLEAGGEVAGRRWSAWSPAGGGNSRTLQHRLQGDAGSFWSEEREKNGEERSSGGMGVCLGLGGDGG